MRLFVALACGAEAAGNLAAWQSGLRASVQGVSWVRPENLHLTLRFLGEVEPSRVAHAAEAVRAAAAAVEPFTLSLRGAGSFPRVLWVGAAGTGLEPLAAAVERELRRAGFGPRDKPFRPHLTIGRVRGAGVDPRALAAGQSKREWGAWQVDGVALMRSRLDPGGAVYDAVLRATLGNASVS